MLLACVAKCFVLLMPERLISVVNFIFNYASEARWCPVHTNRVHWTECIASSITLYERRIYAVLSVFGLSLLILVTKGLHCIFDLAFCNLDALA